MGRFVEIAVDSSGLDAARAREVARACPVDIFQVDDAGALRSIPEREDECILCGRCASLAGGAVVVRRAYGDRGPVTWEGVAGG